jgi:hypothetical protein
VADFLASDLSWAAWRGFRPLDHCDEWPFILGPSGPRPLFVTPVFWTWQPTLALLLEVRGQTFSPLLQVKMRISPRLVVVALCAMVLSACGHGSSGTSAVPAVADPSSGTRAAASVSPPSGTLYVSSSKAVYAYDLAANGPTTPSRTLTPHSLQRVRLLALAAAADGNLGVLEEYYPDTGGHRCRITVESQNASGNAAALAVIDCPGDYSDSYGYGLARNPVLPLATPGTPAGDAFDLLVTKDSTGAAYIKRYDEAGNALSTLTLPSPGPTTALVTDKGGHPYVDDGAGNVKKYQYTSADGGSTAPVASFTMPVASSGVMAVSPVDNALYLVTKNNSNQNVIEGFSFNGAGNSYTPSSPVRTIGPFNNNNVTAMAFDSQGELYVALSSVPGGGAAFGNVVRVYNLAPSTPAIVRTIPNANPSNPTDITAMAISEPPAANGVQQTSGQVGPITFSGYSNGPVRGQNGWLSNSCGNSDYNANVVNTSSYPSAQWPGTPPTKALQIDNSVTQGCFSGLATPVTPKTAGIPTAITDTASMSPTFSPPHCNNPCQPYFTTQFTVTSATGGFQPALEMSISPVWNNQGARQQYIGLWHTQDSQGVNKLLLFTNDVDDVIGATPPCFECADFVAWELAYVDPALPHTVGMTMSFVSPDKDVTQFYVDGSLVGVKQNQFRSWEDYYLYDTESDPGNLYPYSRAVNDLLFHPGNVDSCLNFQDYANNCNQRSGGPDHTSTANNGFLFTNITTCAGTTTSCASAISTTGTARAMASASRSTHSLSTGRLVRTMSQVR